jgi:hypothetical protein
MSGRGNLVARRRRRRSSAIAAKPKANTPSAAAPILQPIEAPYCGLFRADTIAHQSFPAGGGMVMWRLSHFDFDLVQGMTWHML